MYESTVKATRRVLDGACLAICFCPLLTLLWDCLIPAGEYASRVWAERLRILQGTFKRRMTHRPGELWRTDVLHPETCHWILHYWVLFTDEERRSMFR